MFVAYGVQRQVKRKNPNHMVLLTDFTSTTNLMVVTTNLSLTVATIELKIDAARSTFEPLLFHLDQIPHYPPGMENLAHE